MSANIFALLDDNENTDPASFQQKGGDRNVDKTKRVAQRGGRTGGRSYFNAVGTSGAHCSRPATQQMAYQSTRSVDCAAL